MSKRSKANLSQERVRVFLDTTIQVERIFGHSRTRKKILELGKNKNLLTSRFVLSEFKRTILKDTVYLYCLVQREQSVSDRPYRARGNNCRSLADCTISPGSKDVVRRAV